MLRPEALLPGRERGAEQRLGLRGIQVQQDDAALLAKAKAKEAEVEGDKPTKKPPPFK